MQDYVIILTKTRFHLQLSELLIVCPFAWVFAYISFKLRGLDYIPDYIGLPLIALTCFGVYLLLFGEEPMNNEATE